MLYAPLPLLAEEERGSLRPGTDATCTTLVGEGDRSSREGVASGQTGAYPRVSIIELRGEKIARESIYVTESFESPEWRARWRAEP